ncbi:MAG: hypothetical protein HQ579_04805 [Candidatus Omnitrophica bacterium]|nr:hypothetical protein [Candidatus Omnitrophota bacterium]
MIFYLIGIDYKTVSLETMESAHRLRSEMVGYCTRIKPFNTTVLATCNRVEIHGVAKSLEEVVAFQESFRQYFKNCFKKVYLKYGTEEVFRHGLRLACGLESMIQGEYQILQQLEVWRQNKQFPALLKNLWEMIIENAKDTRAKTGLDRNASNVADLIFGDLREHGSLKKDLKILIIGTGKIASLIVEKRPVGTRLIFVARKKHSKAEHLARLSGGEVLPREDMPDCLVSVDAVISATSSPHYVMRAADFTKALEIRKNPLYVYDMAIPRDVSRDVYEIPFVKIRNMDDLAFSHYQESKTNGERVKLASELAEEIIIQYREDINAKGYTNWYAAQPACI